MAIVFDDKQKQDAQAQAQGPDLSNQSASAPMGAQCTGSAFSTAPVSSAGVGSGGTGGWTNIQSYLMANAGNDKSAGALRSTVGGQFDNEKQDFEKSSGDARGGAQKELDRSMNTDQASRTLNNLSGQYNYSGPQSQAYSSGVGQLQGAMKQYEGPTSYSYGMNANTQRYGDALQSNPGFQGLMGDLYRNAAGGQMGQGALNLQRQIDQDNGALNTARSDLAGQYGGLKTQIESGTKDTGEFVSGAQKTVNDNAGGVLQYLTGQKNSTGDRIGKYVNEYRDNLSRVLPAAGYQQGIRGLTADNISQVDPEKRTANTVMDVLKDSGARYGDNPNTLYDRMLGIWNPLPGQGSWVTQTGGSSNWLPWSVQPQAGGGMQAGAQIPDRRITRI